MPKLIPFPSLDHGVSDVTIEANARIEGAGDQRRIVIEHSARGALNKIFWPSNSEAPARKDELWKHTCFEAFIKLTGQDRYWEINLSPSGDWNVYGFSSYRSGMATEHTLSSIKAKVFDSKATQRSLSCEIWLPEWSGVSRFELGLTAVIEEPSGQVSYWALTHAGSQPDFHLADSFTTALSS